MTFTVGGGHAINLGGFAVAGNGLNGLSLPFGQFGLIALGSGGGNHHPIIQDFSVSGTVPVMGLSDTAASGLTGWLNWAGQARVTSDFTVTSSTVLVNVTGLSVNVLAGRTYVFETELYVTRCRCWQALRRQSLARLGLTSIQYTGYTIADNAIKGKTNATALATAVGSTVTTETSGIIVRTWVLIRDTPPAHSQFTMAQIYYH